MTVPDSENFNWLRVGLVNDEVVVEMPNQVLLWNVATRNLSGDS